MPVRDDRIHRYVVAFCPACNEEEPDRPLPLVERLSGYLSVRDDKVWLVRGCARHGRIETLYDEDPEILAYLETWTAPTKVHVPDATGNFDPVPVAYLRGLGELQTQHTCILLEDITSECNLRCPTCFADSAPRAGGTVPIDVVLANVDQRMSRENGALDVVMVSGGEPTLHPDFVEILDELAGRPITRILVNTNGVAPSRDDRLVEAFGRLRDRVEVYLQFDGVRGETHRHHRGADLGAVKLRAIDRLSAAGVFVTLTMTVAKGVNDDEVGDVIGLAMATPFVGGVSIQPQFGSGRSGSIDVMDRLTHGGVLRSLAGQTDGVVSWRDLTALPCSHPHCCSIGYMLRQDDGSWRSLVAAIGHDRLREHLGLVSNRITSIDIADELRDAVRTSLLGLLSEQQSLSHPTITDLFQIVCQTCDIGIGGMLRLAGAALVGGRRRELRRMLSERIVRITVKPFMDMSTMIEERLLQCCVHVGTKNGNADQCAPFCAVQAWAPLADQRLSDAWGAEHPDAWTPVGLR